MRETLSEMAGAENGKAVKRNGNQLRTLGATVEISCHSACPYQKLHWPTISEVSRAPCRCVSDQTLSGVGPSTKKRISHSKRAHGSFCILKQVLGSVLQAGSFAQVKSLQ